MKPQKCCKCKDKAVSWIKTKAYCDICFKRQQWIERTERLEKKRILRAIQ